MIKSDEAGHLTEYSVKFKEHENQTRRAMIRPPKKSIAHDAKMASDTTNRRDFVVYPVTPPSKRLPVEFQPPEKGMETVTEYKNKYLGKWQTPTQPIVPSSNRKERCEPFDPSTTHSTDFRAPPVTPRKLYTAEHNYKPPTTTFDTVSTAHSDFVGYGKVPVTPSLAPPLSVNDKAQPLAGVTSYNSTFTTPAMPEKFEKSAAIYVPSEEKISDLTTFKSSFPKYPYEKPREMKKPIGERCNTDVPFENKTINRLHYKTWELPKKFSRPPTTFVPPTERVSDVTTHRSAYADYGCVPPTPSSKPVQKVNTETAPLDKLTTQNVDYRAWDGVKRPEPFRQDKGYKPPQEKFDPSTTFSTNYRGTFAPRPPNAKPPAKPTSNLSKVDFTTSYNSSFSGPGYKPCESIQLLTNDTEASKYTFSHEDSCGHKLYKPKDNKTVQG